MLGSITRANAIILFLSILFIYLVLSVFKIQVLDHKAYAEQRTYQNSFNQTEIKRGTIYGTLKNGDIAPLAEDETWYKLAVSPKSVGQTYEERMYTLINKVTPIDRDTFYKKLENKNDPYEEIKTITKDEAEKIEALNIPGVSTYKTFKRVYPMNSVGGRIIGFVGGGADNKFIGRYGLEKYYESDLSATTRNEESFFAKIFRQEKNDVTGSYTKDIVTTLEPNVMKFLNSTLIDMKAEWGADEVSAIVMDRDGNIVAMETIPEFDPNNYKEYDLKTFGNPSVQGLYELGSIMKPITIAGGINDGLITPNTIYHDYGFVDVDNYTIKNFDGKARGDVSMQEVISQSLNTGAVYVQKLLGREKFKENFENFGLETQTGIDFPGELTNNTENLNTNTEVNFATAAFGQGVAITPISMLTSLSRLINDGKNMCPHFLKDKVLVDGSDIPYECESDITQAVSSTTANTTKNMMIELIDSGLAHGRYKDKNYKVGAKTGTAQLPSPDGKYYKDKFVHSYFTFFPGENPKYSVLIYQVNPKQGALASLTLAPYASKIKDFLLTYYDVPPDRN